MTKGLLTPMMGIAMLFTASGCKGGDDGSMGTGGMASGGDSHCQELCDVSGTLSCPADDASTCVSDCEQQVAAFPSCSSEFQAVSDCFYQQPAANWECAADTGESTVKDGFCDSQKTALENCAVASLSGN